MKPYPLRAGVIISLLSASLLHAADQYFDTSSANGLTAGNAMWDAGTTHAWAANAAPGTTPPGGWVNGNDAFFQSGGTSTVTLSGPVTAASITHASGTTTLAGTGSLTLTNGVTLSGGTLTIGSISGGSIPDGCGITMSSGTALNFGRSDSTTWTGRINGMTTSDGTVSKTGSGDFNLTLQGGSTFGTIRNSSTTGILTLTTVAAEDEVNTSLRSVLGSSMAITCGIWNAPNLGVNGTGNQMRGSLSISSATVIVANGRYATGNLDILAGGTLRVTGDRLGFNTDQNVPSAAIRILNDGLLEILSTQYGTTIGGGGTSGLTSLVSQQGGTARIGIDNGTNTANRNLVIGATAANSKSAYDLSGGTLLVAGTLSGSVPNATGGLNNFNFRGGILAANAVTMANLGYSTDPANPVFDSASVGTLVNRGGTTGKTVINGNYLVNSGTLAIDIAGTSAATTFQGTSSQFDNGTVTGSATLGGDLAVHLRQGFVPAQSDVFTVLTAGSLGGVFANVASGSRLTSSPTLGSFLVTVSGTSVVLSDYQPDPNAGPEIACSPQSTGTLAGQDVYLSVVATGDGPLRYQWRKDGVAIDGATSASYIVSGATLADAGTYDVIITDDTGSKTSTASVLTVAPAGSIDPLVAASAYANQSVWSYHDSVPIPWSLFKARDYGSSQITFDAQGVTPLGRVPAPGVHPRIFFSNEDLPALRQRIQTTTGGQEAWKNLLSYCHVMKRTYDKNQDYAKP
jgi:hypothetical protein